MPFKFQNFDFLHLDSSFTEDELLVRRTARDFVEDNLIPIIEECFREGRFPRELVPLMGELGFFGANHRGLRLRRHVQRRVRPGHAGTGARRLRPAQLCQRAVGAGHVPHLHLRLRRAEEHLAPRPRQRRKDRLLRPHRARLRVEPRRHDHHAPAKPATSTFSTAKKCGSPPAPSPMSPSSGPRSKTRTGMRVRGFLVETDRPGFSAHGSPRQVEPARLGHQRPLSAGRAHPRRQPAARHGRPEEPAHVPQPGPLRHQLGRASARPWTATRPRSSTPSCASNSTTSPSPAISSSRKSSSGWRAKSPRPNCSRCTWAA